MHPHLAHHQPAPERLRADDSRIEVLARARGQRGSQDVARRVDRVGAGEHHRLAVERLLHHRQDLAREARLPGAQDHGGVLVVGPVGHQGAHAFEVDAIEHPIVERAHYHAVTAVELAPRFVGIVLDQERRHLGALELVEERRNRRPGLVDQNRALLQLRRRLRKTRLEALLEHRDQVEREDQEDQEDADELEQDHEQDGHRVAPGRIPAVAGRRQGLGRELETLQEGSRLALQRAHHHHVDHGRRHDQSR